MYSLFLLPKTHLFVAAGMASIKPLYIIPAFFIGKFTSDAFALSMGEICIRYFGFDHFKYLIMAINQWFGGKRTYALCDFVF